MASISYADVITPLTIDQIRAQMIVVLAAAFPEIPVTAWGETDEPRATLEFEAEVFADLSQTISGIGRLAVLRASRGVGRTLVAKEWYGIDRDPAQILKGSVTLGDSTGSPQTFTDGQLLFVSSDDPDLVYKNVGTVTVPASGTAPCPITAESGGSKYNVQGSTLSLGTPLPGLSLTVSTGLAWVTSAGADEETDEELLVRCETKQAGQSVTGPEDAYVSWVLDASAELNRVRVIEHPTALPPSPAVSVIVAGPAGAASSSARTAANTKVQQRRPTGTLVEVVSAGAYSFDLRGTVRVRTSARTAAEAEVKARLRKYFEGTAQTINDELLEGLGIGEKVYLSQVIEIIHSVPGVLSVTLTDAGGTPIAPGTADVTPLETGVAVLNNLLAFTNV